MRGDTRAILLAAGAFAVFSLTDALAKWLSRDLPVAQVGLMVTAIALGLVLVAARGGLRPRQPRLALLRGALLAADTLLIFYAFSRLDLTEAYALAFTAPLLVALVSTVFLQERLRQRGWLGVGLGFLGVLVVLQPQTQQLNAGHLAALASALAFALSIVVLRRVDAEEKDGAILFVVLLMIALTAAVLTGGDLMPLDAAQAAVVGLAGVLMALGHWLLIRAGRLGAASLVAPMQYSQLIWAALWGAALFGSPLGPALLAGAGLIILSGWLVSRAGPLPLSERPQHG